MLIGVYLRRTGCRVGVLSLDVEAMGGVLPAGKIDLWLGVSGVKTSMEMIRSMTAGRDLKRVGAEVVIPGLNGNTISIVVTEAAVLHGVRGYTHDA